jgi:hypothetical protein
VDSVDLLSCGGERTGPLVGHDNNGAWTSSLESGSTGGGIVLPNIVEHAEQMTQTILAWQGGGWLAHSNAEALVATTEGR